jgi:hypothetical protein
MKILKHHIHHLIKLTLTFLLATILLLWGWNSTMPDLLGLPAMQFKHAMGLMILIGIASLFLHHGRGQGGRKRSSSQNNNPVMEKQL